MRPKPTNNNQGFSLIELLIVVAILGILSAIAIPNYLTARQSGNQASAIASLRNIYSTQATFQTTNRRFGTLAELGAGQFLQDPNLVSGFKSQYQFIMPVVTQYAFEANANPITPIGQWNHYFINDTGMLRRSLGSPATASSTPQN